MGQDTRDWCGICGGGNRFACGCAARIAAKYRQGELDSACHLERNRILSIIRDIVDEQTYELIEKMVMP